MLNRLFASLVDLLVPPRRTESHAATLTLDDLQYLAHEDGLPYRNKTVRDLIWEIKYYGNGRAAKIAGEYLADELLAIAAEEIGKPLLIPIPMHPTRRRERGHNQTEVLCEAALHALNGSKSDRQNSLGAAEGFLAGTFAPAFEYAPNVLKRTVHTRHQQGLQRSKRLKNVDGSMRVVDPDRVAGRVCVVVDDVATTGATLAEAKRALLNAKARRVHCVALARS